MPNQFIDEKTFPYEIEGYFEELILKDAGGAYGFKLLGTRRIPEPTRALGSDGRVDVVITETLELQKGHKNVTVKASPARPLLCFSMLHVICGKSKEPHINPLYR